MIAHLYHCGVFEQKVRDTEQEKIDAIEQMKRKLHDERMGTLCVYACLCVCMYVCQYI
jgi:hypothetical protein